jgi:processive 1,2-diacylglycerol beta-glucosyltransferase/1,2-diacylglycerol 3-beta-galactosyltransferase
MININTMGKYLFLYLKTGGGHLAPAKAVAEKIKTKRRVDVEILLVDGLSESNTVVKKVIEDGYKNAINKAAWTFEFLYALHKISFVSKTTAALVSFFVKPGIERQILETRPKKIVIFHFFLIKPVFEIIKKHNLDIPVLTVVTDPFTAHPIWFQQENQNYIVFSDILKEKCLEKGINKENLHVFPFVLDSKFSQKVSDFKKIRIRKKLGFEVDSKIILIMGGGDGMPRGKKILRKIIARNMDAEIAIVCGKNQKLYDKAIKLKNKFGIDNLKVFGFIDFVHSLVSISDVVITKCGASTSMEILMMGKVPVINNYIWEQEKGNMEFVCNSKMGILEKNTRYLPDILHRLLTDNEFYNSLINNIKNAAISNGVGQVSDYILEYQ